MVDVEPEVSRRIELPTAASSGLRRIVGRVPAWTSAGEAVSGAGRSRTELREPEGAASAGWPGEVWTADFAEGFISTGWTAAADPGRAGLDSGLAGMAPDLPGFGPGLAGICPGFSGIAAPSGERDGRASSAPPRSSQTVPSATASAPADASVLHRMSVVSPGVPSFAAESLTAAPATGIRRRVSIVTE